MPPCMSTGFPSFCGSTAAVLGLHTEIRRPQIIVTNSQLRPRAWYWTKSRLTCGAACDILQLALLKGGKQGHERQTQQQP